MPDTDAKPFDPAEHRFGPTHWFEDLKIGQKFYINSRTQTEALFSAFQLASGDNHPIHYDREYCKALGHRDMLAHGLQVAIQGAAGCQPLAWRIASEASRSAWTSLPVKK